jgi:PAS domain S-box-containing protein
MSALPILVVEDNAATRKMMRLALKAEGYSVLEAEDGQGALRLASDQGCAMVLLDCKLPDMDGFEVARRLRALDPSLPVIAVTGWAQTDEARVLSAGFRDVLVKPIEPSRLVEVVQRHVGQAPTRSAPSGRTVLLADDDAAQRKLGHLMLTNAGFEVVLAEDGEVALRLAQERKPDAIVSDVLMPRMDGFALCRAVRTDPNLAHVPLVLMSSHFLEEEDRQLAARFGATRYVSRTDGFDAVTRAVLDAIESPAVESVVPPTEDLQGEYLRRIARQLERQASIGAGLARRVSIQATALSVLGGLSDSLARQLDPENALGETLAECLDAAGLSVGAVLLYDDKGKLVVKAHVGSPIEQEWGEHAEVLSLAIHSGGLMIPSRGAGDAGQGLLAGIGASSALVVPIVARDLPLGILLLASNGTDLAGAEAESFVRTAQSVSRQLGQALALSRMFSKLSAAEQRYRALLENARDAIGVVSIDGIILEANHAWENLLGFGRDQVVGRKVSDFALEGARETHQSEYEKAVAQGGGSIPPIALKRADGTVAKVELSRTVIDIGGERFILSVGRDVTDRLRLEEQFRQAQKMEAVGRLAGGVAHDFNNVLSVILSYSDFMLADLKPGDPMRGDVEEVQKAGKRAADLTRQLLMFSRQQVIEPKVMDLNEVLTDMDKMLQRILGEDIDLVSLPGQDLGRVRVDPSGIEQVVMNLVVNARDAMPTGGKLTIETANVVLDGEYVDDHIGAKPGPHVMLAVSDSGTGIDAAIRARIFEPFFTTKEMGKGTGLGLSTVFGIVRQNDGSIWVYSEPGKGTTFKIYLPRVDAALEVTRRLGPALAHGGSETLLLVEDDDQVRVVARGILRRQGYQLLEARNAGEALIASEQHKGPIHLLVTDVVMPQLSGPELAKRLAAARPEMKLLCMSGYTDDAIVRHGILEARIAYLQKPITPDTLARKVREVLDR